MATCSSENDKRLVHTLAIGLAENLLHHYPDTDKSPDAAQVQCWLNEILERIEQQHGSTGDGNGAAASASTTDNESDLAMAQLVMKEGIQRWKSKLSIFPSASAKKAGSVSKSMTFSFLDQWNAAGTGGGLSLLDSIITWDRIQQQSTLDSKLELLLKVQHMDDIHPDWDKVCPLLLQGLQQQSTATTTTDISEDNVDAVDKDGDPSSVGDFIKFHETLFEQSRSSPEYTTAQIQLCQNIVSQLQASLATSANPISTGTSDNSRSRRARLFRRLIRAFWNMWMDWMVSRGGGPNSNVNLVESIGRDVWSCYSYDSVSAKRTDNATNQTFPTVLMQVMMLEQDPYARWFTSWVAHLPASKVVSLVESAPQLVRFTVLACERSTSGCKDNDGDDDGHDNDNHDTLCRHSLVLLASILRQTRVSLFPWHIIILDDGALASVSRFFDLFHDAIERNLQSLTVIPANMDSARRNAPDLERIGVCADAMETLLWGCAETDPITFRALLTKLDGMLCLDVMDSTDVGAQVRELLNGIQRRLRDRLD